ncbi:ribonucleoside triphosphate reductase [Candidatus Woesearchaeota archaeon]|nr:ribonucleoside triphosphate reductase [Candidatus Woesearchaeota archaeon]
MVDRIKKRDGRIVDFDKEKITNAIFKAAQAVGGEDRKLSEELALEVVSIINEKFRDAVPSVEEVQDIVEKVLIEKGHARTSKAYILYREQHKNIRQFIGLIRDISMVDDYIDESDWQVRENSNMTFSLQGLNVHITSKVISNYWLNSTYPRDIREAHKEGDFHIHDLGTLGPYCVGWDLKDILVSGFKGVRGKIESKPAKHFDVVLLQVVNFLYTLQGEAAGAQALSNFDTLMAPFIRYDNLDYKEVKQAIQKFLFNMNVPTRVGFQTPFTNITLDLKCPEFMKNESVIIGGEIRDETYGEFQKEMDMFNNALAEVIMAGDAKGRPFTFPIPTYNITKDFEWDNENYDKIWQMTSKYGIPYFSNFVNSDMKPDDVRSMCCRLRIDNRELKKRGGGLFGSNPLTGSIGVVTINMPRIGFLSKDEDDFFRRLGSLMDIAKQSLIIKREILEAYTERGLYPYSKYYLRNIKKAEGKYWKNHFSTIGLVGMNEAVYNLFGKTTGDEEGKRFAEKTLMFMRKKLSDYQQETGSIFNLEATPAEGTSYRLARLDRIKYPDIRFYNQDKRGKEVEPYYTNSSQLPVDFSDDFFEALELQDSLQIKYTGGTVLHGFIGESPDPEITKKLVKKIADNFHLPYYSITPTFSICPQHGYISGKHLTCDKCGSKCEIWSRSVGYLRPVEQWHDGKQEEFKERKTFDRQLKPDEVKKLPAETV